MKKTVLFLLIFAFIFSLPAGAVVPETELDVSVPHAILMEKQTGTVIWEKDADTSAPPASVTKVMTILLIVEAIERGDLSLDDTITASARASSMGGSQIYLKEGESMTLRDMLKSIVVASANDAAVAVAEHLCGTEESFVARMNSRAQELGMKNTSFTNCTGLFDDDNHYTSARDVALMSRELIRHEMIRDYTTIWMDTVRGGEFGLSNTNKLVNRYEGCTGLKTGYTSLAGHCLSATAERNGTEYIAVVMGASSSEERFNAASAMLNFAFANYTVAELRPPVAIAPVPVLLGKTGSLQPVLENKTYMLLQKSEVQNLDYDIQLAEKLSAPISAGQEVGTVSVTLNGQEVARLSLTAPDAIAKRTPLDIFIEMFAILFGD